MEESGNGDQSDRWKAVDGLQARRGGVRFQAKRPHANRFAECERHRDQPARQCVRDRFPIMKPLEVAVITSKGKLERKFVAHQPQHPLFGLRSDDGHSDHDGFGIAAGKDGTLFVACEGHIAHFNEDCSLRSQLAFKEAEFAFHLAMKDEKHLLISTTIGERWQLHVSSIDLHVCVRGHVRLTLQVTHIETGTTTLFPAHVSRIGTAVDRAGNVFVCASKRVMVWTRFRRQIPRRVH